MNERSKYTKLNQWFGTQQGKDIASAFASQLKNIDLPLSSSQRVLQLGMCADNLWLNAFAHKQVCCVSPAAIPAEKTVYASMHNLPLDRDSIDCVIAPFSVEISSKKMMLFDEIDRVLAPMGTIIFLGINPYGAWGILPSGRRLCLGSSSIKLRSALWVQHTLLAKGYRLCHLTSFYYIPPLKQQSWLERLEFLNQMGKMVWPFPAGFYCLMMQKHDIRLNLIAGEELKEQNNYVQACAYWAKCSIHKDKNEYNRPD